MKAKLIVLGIAALLLGWMIAVSINPIHKAGAKSQVEIQAEAQAANAPSIDHGPCSNGDEQSLTQISKGCYGGRQ